MGLEFPIVPIEARHDPFNKDPQASKLLNMSSQQHLVNTSTSKGMGKISPFSLRYFLRREKRETGGHRLIVSMLRDVCSKCSVFAHRH